MLDVELSSLIFQLQGAMNKLASSAAQNLMPKGDRSPTVHGPQQRDVIVAALDSISAENIWRGLISCESLEVNTFDLDTTANYLAKALEASSRDEQDAWNLVHQAQYTFAQDPLVKAAILRTLT
jgi:hypothetical protein